MRDRVTGEARGFGFVSIDAAAAETVEQAEHIIGNRKVKQCLIYVHVCVESEQLLWLRSVTMVVTAGRLLPQSLACSAQIDVKRSLPHPKKTRKIFVGGLGADVHDGNEQDVTTHTVDCKPRMSAGWTKL